MWKLIALSNASNLLLSNLLPDYLYYLLALVKLNNNSCGNNSAFDGFAKSYSGIFRKLDTF